MARFTSVERRIDEWAHRRLGGVPEHGWRARIVEFIVFVLKQAWACVFGAAILSLIIATALWYPDGAALARNDFLVLGAIAIQLVMLVFRLETPREALVIVMFHVVGTGMEIFKTNVGSWIYEGEGFLHIAGVPLYSGFMYAAIGSYMVRVYRLFDLRFDRYPRRWITAILAVLIYINFFSHHYIWDFRWLLFVAVFATFGFCTMHVRIFRATIQMPVLLSFFLVSFFIWIAENIGTWANAWQYPNQVDGWQVVSIAKLGSWFLLIVVSVVLVAWIYPPRPPGGLDRETASGKGW
jgi:uncharacterized membrane protein YoaT (DUF817 family)